MSSNSPDWSALASHNERVVAMPAPTTGPQPRLPSRSRAGVRARLRLRKRATRTGTAARA